MSDNRQKLGRWGENLAAIYLESRGYVVQDRNVRNQYGELDLVVRYQEITVFVEVKTRSSVVFGYPETGITYQKQMHLLNAARQYLLDHPFLDGDWRVDVIAIYRQKGQPPEITHFENAIS